LSSLNWLSKQVILCLFSHPQLLLLVLASVLHLHHSVKKLHSVLLVELNSLVLLVVNLVVLHSHLAASKPHQVLVLVLVPSLVEE